MHATLKYHGKSALFGATLWLALIVPGKAAPPLPGPLLAGWQGKPVCERVHEDDKQRILRCKFEPGVGHERHFHTPHFGYALTGGRMRITDERGVREVELPTGSSYTSPGVDWHEVLNVGNTTVTYLIVESK